MPNAALKKYPIKKAGSFEAPTFRCSPTGPDELGQKNLR
jgi:hypothetical protein